MELVGRGAWRDVYKIDNDWVLKIGDVENCGHHANSWEYDHYLHFIGKDPGHVEGMEWPQGVRPPVMRMRDAGFVELEVENLSAYTTLHYEMSECDCELIPGRRWEGCWVDAISEVSSETDAATKDGWLIPLDLGE